MHRTEEYLDEILKIRKNRNKPVEIEISENKPVEIDVNENELVPMDDICARMEELSKKIELWAEGKKRFRNQEATSKRLTIEEYLDMKMEYARKSGTVDIFSAKYDGLFEKSSTIKAYESKKKGKKGKTSVYFDKLAGFMEKRLDGSIGNEKIDEIVSSIKGYDCK